MKRSIEELVREIEEAYALGHIGYSLYCVLMAKAQEAQKEVA